MPERNEQKQNAAPATEQQTAQKNPGSTAPPTEKSALFPPPGFLHGHIVIRGKVNPDRFTILGSNGRYYTYAGKPKKGEFLNRLGPVIFRPSFFDQVAGFENRDALRVSPAVTRWTVDRGLQVTRRAVLSV